MVIFTSCHTIEYSAIYEIKRTGINSGSIEKFSTLIQQVARQSKVYLVRDEKYKSNDTIAYFGQPYHYFKFVITQKDTQRVVVKLDYHGSLGKKGLYKTFLNTMSDSIHANFNIIKAETKELTR